MKHIAFPTKFGHCGLVYEIVEGKVQVDRVLLPTTKKTISSKLRTHYPHAKKGEHASILQLTNKITRYFEGKERQLPIDVLNLSICGTFQKEVLKVEWSIPYGMTASYGWVARQLGTRAARAVGNALARNPFPIIIPCHRAVRSNRTIGGFQGGPNMKRKLLELEGVAFDTKGKVSTDHFIM